jgi:nucleotidyltransferase substrate binding protein (TIGR01987 family)
VISLIRAGTRKERGMDDIRWKQRFNNFQKAFQALADAVMLAQTRDLSNLETQGMIQSFEFTHELAWNVLKDYLEYIGFMDIVGSRDASRLAFRNGLIEDGDGWMRMIEARNLTTHTYNLSVAEEVEHDILERYYPAFLRMSMKFTSLYEQGAEHA